MGYLIECIYFIIIIDIFKYRSESVWSPVALVSGNIQKWGGVEL